MALNNPMDRMYMSFSLFKEYLVSNLDFNQYGLYVVYTTPSIDFWCMGPARYVFKIIGDMSVYLVFQKDLFPGFDPLDYLLWINGAANCAIGVSSVSWNSFEKNSHLFSTAAVEFVSVPSDKNHTTWEFFNLYQSAIFEDTEVFIDL